MGEWLLHGHTHTDMKVLENCIHVGLDVWDLQPVYVDDIAALMTPAPSTTSPGSATTSCTACCSRSSRTG